MRRPSYPGLAGNIPAQDSSYTQFIVEDDVILLDDENSIATDFDDNELTLEILTAFKVESQYLLEISANSNTGSMIYPILNELFNASETINGQKGIILFGLLLESTKSYYNHLRQDGYLDSNLEVGLANIVVIGDTILSSSPAWRQFKEKHASYNVTEQESDEVYNVYASVVKTMEEAADLVDINVVNEVQKHKRGAEKYGLTEKDETIYRLRIMNNLVIALTSEIIKSKKDKPSWVAHMLFSRVSKIVSSIKSETGNLSLIHISEPTRR